MEVGENHNCLTLICWSMILRLIPLFHRIALDVYGMNNDGAELGSGPIALQEHLEKVLIGMKILLAISVFFKRVVRWI